MRPLTSQIINGLIIIVCLQFEYKIIKVFIIFLRNLAPLEEVGALVEIAAAVMVVIAAADMVATVVAVDTEEDMEIAVVCIYDLNN